VPLLTVHGEHDLTNEDVLRDGLATALAYRSAVVVDLSDASFVGSSVLHTLAGASAPGQGTVVVCPRADALGLAAAEPATSAIGSII
jgi:anti-anti-sigma regulatory factor